jgi:hypothetical protein
MGERSKGRDKGKLKKKPKAVKPGVRPHEQPRQVPDVLKRDSWLVSASSTFERAAALASVGFGDLFGAGKLTGLDAERFSQGTHGASWRSGTSAFQSCDGQGMHAGSPRELSLRKETLESEAA